MPARSVIIGTYIVGVLILLCAAHIWCTASREGTARELFLLASTQPQLSPQGAKLLCDASTSQATDACRQVHGSTYTLVGQRVQDDSLRVDLPTGVNSMQVWADGKSKHSLDARGSAWHAGEVTSQTGCVNLGVNDDSRETNAGRMCYRTWDKDALELVGAGSQADWNAGKHARKVRIHDELHVNRDVVAGGELYSQAGCVNLGTADAGREMNAGRVCYRTWDKNALELVGAGSQADWNAGKHGRLVRIHDRLVVNDQVQAGSVQVSQEVRVGDQVLTADDIRRIKSKTA